MSSSNICWCRTWDDAWRVKNKRKHALALRWRGNVDQYSALSVCKFVLCVYVWECVSVWCRVCGKVQVTDSYIFTMLWDVHECIWERMCACVFSCNLHYTAARYCSNRFVVILRVILQVICSLALLRLSTQQIKWHLSICAYGFPVQIKYLNVREVEYYVQGSIMLCAVT